MRLFVPGRVCLFGEHSDWAGGHRRDDPSIEPGYALIAGTDQGIHATVERLPNRLRLSSVSWPGRNSTEIPMDRESLRAEAERGGFWSYVAGVALVALERYGTGGLALDNDRTDLPIGKGLSSSAAICVLAARAFNRLYDLGLDVQGEMDLAYAGETATPSRCGRMDQACAFGRRPVLLTFDADRVDAHEVRVGREMHLLIVDLVARKDTVRILSRLQAAFLGADHLETPTSGVEARSSEHNGTANADARAERRSAMRELLGPINRRIVHEAIAELEAGDAPGLGALMEKAQAAFDSMAAPACPEELTAPVLHAVLRHKPLRPYIWGAKGIGSQGDGSAQLLARSEGDRREAARILRRDLGMSSLDLTLRPGGALPG